MQYTRQMTHRAKALT